VYTAELGKHKVPTLRNIDKRPSKDFVRAYGHNGVFKSLEEIVHFYNTREVEDWPAPEVTENVNPFIGDLGLTADEEAAVVAFLRTLTDGYKPPREDRLEQEQGQQVPTDERLSRPSDRQSGRESQPSARPSR
ncbi:MAG: hypothetical protein ACPG4Q_15245, partial [Phycisphaeraceae bacterium]